MDYAKKELAKSLMVAKAYEIYMKMDDSSKAVVAFGMTPVEAVNELEEFMGDMEYESKEIALSFMEVAKMPGGAGMVV